MPPAASRLFHNWRLKLSALGLSLFLWAVVQSEPSNREAFSTVPVRVEVLDTAWTMSAPPSPSSVEVRVGGVAREVLRLAREGTTLRVPITAVGSNDTVVSVRREWVEASQRPGVTVESVFPATIALSFERAATRMIPVAPRVRGSLPDGMALGAALLPNPQFVRIRGPESRVMGLDSIPLVPLDLGSIPEGGTFTIAVDTAGLAGSSVVPPAVSVSVRAEDVVDRVLLDVSVRVDSTAAPLPAPADDTAAGSAEIVLEPSLVELRLSGPRSLVAGVDPDRVTVEVEGALLGNLAVGETRRVPVRVQGVPAGVLASTVPEFVTVRRADEPGGRTPIGSVALVPTAAAARPTGSRPPR